MKAPPRVLVTNTIPYFFHAPGLPRNLDYLLASQKHSLINPLWQPLLSSIERERQPSQQVTKTTTYLPSDLVEFITIDSGHFPPVFESSMRRKLLSVTTLKPTGDYTDWKNVYKLPMLIEHLDSSRYQFVCFCDAYDVVCTRLPTDLEKLLLLTQKQMLISAEKFFYPPFDDFEQSFVGKQLNTLKKRQLHDAPSIFRHLNSGVWIAKREFATIFLKHCWDIHLSLYNSIEAPPGKDQLTPSEKRFITESDQLLFQLGYLDFQEHIGIDFQCRLACTLAGIPDDLEHVRLPRKLTAIPQHAWKTYVLNKLLRLKGVILPTRN
jgi:hypothetical protein